MRKFIIILLSVVLLSFLFQACKSEEVPVGAIRILSVTPNSGLVGGVETDFVVEVEYELSNTSQGELCVGFNTPGIDIYGIYSSEDFIISEGSGQHTFYADNVTPKDWGAAGDFKAFVIISEYPHGTGWIPLDSDTMVLTFF